MTHHWQPFDDECPECGASIEVLTTAPEGYVYDGEDWRCVDCDAAGWVSVDSEADEVSLHLFEERGR